MGNRHGANDGDRTRDNRYHKPALYQLSYVRHMQARLKRLTVRRQPQQDSKNFFLKEEAKTLSPLSWTSPESARQRSHKF